MPILKYMLINKDCLIALKELEPNSIDSIITDPPAGISFMGKDWDSNKGGRDQWVLWFTEVMAECRRVLKPGAHGFVWAIPRTSHWTATALENAGFEIRDIVTHVFGSGFPKSHNVSKAIDKKFGAEREIVGFNKNHRSNNGKVHDTGTMCGEPHTDNGKITKSSTNQAKQWDGYGTALKPASEHWILVRKPLSEKSIVDNVLKHGTGGINIDGCRIESRPRTPGYRKPGTKYETSGQWNEKYKSIRREVDPNNGRFPANFICSGEAREMLDEQSGVLKQGGAQRGSVIKSNGGGYESAIGKVNKSINKELDSYGASRFFYCAKASKSERNAGLEGLEVHRYGAGIGEGKDPNAPTIDKNHHPTVKPLKLMKYLITMITPPNGVVLDPFMGSGSTGVACLELGFDFIGIEREQEYFEIAKERIKHSS